MHRPYTPASSACIAKYLTNHPKLLYPLTPPTERNVKFYSSDTFVVPTPQLLMFVNHFSSALL
jgi:hypothetical protein